MFVTEFELARIEAALGVVLPGAYRRLITPYPVAALRGNTDTELWDDAARLIELNQELRAGGAMVRPWPEHMFALGRDACGSVSAIDIRHPDWPVWWADRGHLDAVGSGEVAPSLEAWAALYVVQLRSDLQMNGVDPEGPPEARTNADDQAARAGCQLLLGLVGFAVLVVLAAWVLVKWLAP
jgi:hypothetical protein